MTLARLQRELTELGFTEYEARVYLALLKDSPATGYQISKGSGVPRSMVYEALGRLDLRGAVMSTRSGRTTLYRPVPPDMLLDRYEAGQRELINSLRSGLAEVNHRELGAFIWRIRGVEQVRMYMRQMIDTCGEELFLVLPDPELGALRPAIIEADQRGIRVRALLTGEGSLAVGEVARHPSRESELQQLTHVALVEADRRQALIANTLGEVDATVTEDRNLVIIARQFVWMELLAQRLAAQLGPEGLERLEPAAQMYIRELQEAGDAEA